MSSDLSFQLSSKCIWKMRLSIWYRDIDWNLKYIVAATPPGAKSGVAPYLYIFRVHTSTAVPDFVILSQTLSPHFQFSSTPLVYKTDYFSFLHINTEIILNCFVFMSVTSSSTKSYNFRKIKKRRSLKQFWHLVFLTPWSLRGNLRLVLLIVIIHYWTLILLIYCISINYWGIG